MSADAEQIVRDFVAWLDDPKRQPIYAPGLPVIAASARMWLEANPEKD